MTGAPPDGVAGLLHRVPSMAGGGVAGQPARGSGGGVGVSVFGEDVELDERVAPVRTEVHRLSSPGAAVTDASGGAGARGPGLHAGSRAVQASGPRRPPGIP